jgi:HD-like signal output (HDOD) protein
MSPRYSAETIEEKIERLPLIDAAAFEILSLLNDPQSNFEKIIAQLSPDVTALFLNMANKAYYGKTVRSINYAVTLLGFKAMRQILITSFLLDHFIKQLGLKHFNFDKFQKQSHFCADVSGALADVMDYKNIEDLFTVSMLYNIGKLIIVAYFSEEHQKIVDLKNKEGISTSEAEQQVLGITHAHMGGLALERFNIPQDICDAVRYHDRWDRVQTADSNFQLAVISRQAAQIVHQYRLPDDDRPQKLKAELQNTAAQARNSFQDELAACMDTDNYHNTFLNILTQVSGLLMDTLKEFGLERTG